MVCGSIGYGGVEEIRRLYFLLQENGFDIVDHLVRKGVDYSSIKDFRDEKELSQKIVEHDLESVGNSDIVVALANGPSYGTAIEIFIAKNTGKNIVLLAKDPVPTPWPINYSDHIVKSENELVDLLHKLTKGR
jgi:nucleoside 2-deoxyribosyltransferase